MREEVLPFHNESSPLGVNLEKKFQIFIFEKNDFF